MSMSVSALFSSMTTLSTPLSIQTRTSYNPVSAPKVVSGMGGVVIECSSRPHKKATAHHMKTRPKKTAGWELRRRPTVYAPLPSLPPDFTVVGSAASESVPNDVSPATPPD